MDNTYNTVAHMFERWHRPKRAEILKVLFAEVLDREVIAKTTFWDERDGEIPVKVHRVAFDGPPVTTRIEGESRRGLVFIEDNTLSYWT